MKIKESVGFWVKLSLDPPPELIKHLRISNIAEMDNQYFYVRKNTKVSIFYDPNRDKAHKYCVLRNITLMTTLKQSLEQKYAHRQLQKPQTNYNATKIKESVGFWVKLSLEKPPGLIK